MTVFLLDINVLIALLDPAHTLHDRAHEWFSSNGKKAWATCPLTENGVLRIIGHSQYPNSPGTPAAAAKLLSVFFELAGHTFWPDDISLLDPKRFNKSRLLDSGQVTDSYLLALAIAHQGRLATFDQRLVTDAVANGSQALHMIR